MKETITNETAATLVAFHIGRGGQFNNDGHISVIDFNKSINRYTEDLFVNFENMSEILDAIEEKDNLKELFFEASSDKVKEATFERKTGLKLCKLIYTDMDGNPVGLDFENDGTGKINIDNDYDTTYVKRLEDCSENELELIKEYKYFVPADVTLYVEEKLNDL